MFAASDLIRAQRRELGAMSADARALSLRIAQDNVARLEAKLERMPAGSWSRASAEATLAQLRLAVRDLVVAQQTGLRAKLAEAATASVRSAAAYIGALDQTYLGVVRPLRFDTAEWLADNAKASGVRVREFERSFRRYGGKVVVEIEQEIARAIMVGESWVDARTRVIDITKVTLGRNQALVDRITRTEVSAAYNGTRLKAMLAEDRPGDRMMKMLSAVFDSSTGRDSVLVHGQKRPVNEPFEDDKGRLYQAPPNRPRDREMVVPWRESWGAEPADGMLEDQPVDPAPTDAWTRHGLEAPKRPRRAGEPYSLGAEISRLKRQLTRQKRSLPSVATPEARAVAQDAVAATARRLEALGRQLERAKVAKAAARHRAERIAARKAASEQARLRELEAKRDLLDVLRGRRAGPTDADIAAARGFGLTDAEARAGYTAGRDLTTVEGRAAARGATVEQQRTLERVRRMAKETEAEAERVRKLTPEQRIELEISKQRAELDKFRTGAVNRAGDPARARRMEELRREFEAMGVQTIQMDVSPTALLSSEDLDVIGAYERRIARLERLRLLDAQNRLAGGAGAPMPTHKAAVEALKARGADVGRLPAKGMPPGWVQVVEAELRQLDYLAWAPDLSVLETANKKRSFAHAQAWMRAGGDLIGDIRAARKCAMGVSKRQMPTFRPSRLHDLARKKADQTPFLAGAHLSDAKVREIVSRYASLGADHDELVHLVTTIHHEFGHGMDYNLRQLALSDRKAKIALDAWTAAAKDVSRGTVERLRTAARVASERGRGLTGRQLLLDAPVELRKGTWLEISEYAASEPAEGLAEAFSLASLGEWDAIPEQLHAPLRGLLELTSRP